MDNLRDPQGLSSDCETVKKMNYLIKQGCTVIHDGFGVRVQQLRFKDRKYSRVEHIEVNKIRRDTLDECITAFKNGKWD